MNIEKVLDYLQTEEGSTIHRNKTESDITTPYGIYRDKHPDAEIFDYIDSIGRELKFPKKTRDWTKGNINSFNELMSHNKSIKTEMRNLARLFYLNYLKGVHLELFPEECQVAMYSMYTNSQEGAWISVQNAIIDIYKTFNLEVTELPTQKLSPPDGDYGTKTRDAMIYLNDRFKTEFIYPYYLESLIISNMKTYYAKLAVKSPTKFLKYLDGWNNRVNRLQEMR